MAAISKLTPVQIPRFYSRWLAHNSLVKQSALIAALAGCNAALGILMSWYVVAWFGVGAETDAFFASTAIPQVTFNLLIATLLPVLVPIFATQEDEHFRREVWSLFSLICTLFIFIALILCISTAIWVPLFVPGFSVTAKGLTLNLTRLQLVSAVLNAAIVTLWAAHHARQRFVWVELTGVVANAAGMGFLILTLPRLGIWAAAFNGLFYNCLKLLFLVPIIGRCSWPNWRAQVVKDIWHRMKPVLPNHAYLRTEPVLDRFLTSMTSSGTLSLFFVAQQIYASVILLLGKAVIAPMAPRLAIDARAENWAHYRRTIRTRFILVLGITVLGWALAVVGAPLFRAFVNEGVIKEHNLRTLWFTMIALGGMLVGGALVQAIAGGFYAMGNTRTPSKVSAIIYTFYVPIKIAAFFEFGLIGLSVSMSCYFLTNCVIQAFLLRKEVRRKHVL